MLAFLFDIRRQNVIKNLSLEELDANEGFCIKSFTDRWFANCITKHLDYKSIQSYEQGFLQFATVLV